MSVCCEYCMLSVRSLCVQQTIPRLDQSHRVWCVCVCVGVRGVCVCVCVISKPTNCGRLNPNGAVAPLKKINIMKTLFTFLFDCV